MGVAQPRPVSMTAELMTLQVRSRRQWRAWLAKAPYVKSRVWLVFHKAHTGVKSIPYGDTVREALCFGWIDSLIKRLDDDRYALKVTPRQPRASGRISIGIGGWNLRLLACSRRPVSQRHPRTIPTRHDQ